MSRTFPARSAAGVVLTLGCLAGCTSFTSSADPASGAGRASTSSATGSASLEGNGAAGPSTAASPAAQTSEESVATDPPPITGQPAEVVVTVLGWNVLRDQVEAAAYMPGEPRTGGTCTLVLTRDGQEVTATQDVEPDAAATSCGDLSVPAVQLSSGTWTGRVDYQQDGVTVSSAQSEVAVP